MQLTKNKKGFDNIMGILNVIKKGSYYTVGEELNSAISHGIAALLAVAGTVILIVFSAFQGDPWKMASSIVYGVSLIILFAMSTMYHSLVNPRAKKVFQIFDHTSIFLLIAGTYTPITLVSLREDGAWGWVVFAIVWASAIIGIILNSISVKRFKKFSLICYIASGWSIVLAIIPFFNAVSLGGILLLFAGGLFYTGGVFFYKKKLKKHYHTVWHWCVTAAAICHYFCILFYVVLPVGK